MANTVGPLIKDARGKAKLSQEALAGQIDGLSAADLGKAERGEKELPQSVLRQIAKITGVTQSSLINAAKESTYGAEKKTANTKKPAATTEKKTTATAKKPAAASEKKASAAAKKPAASEKKTTATAKKPAAASEKKTAATAKNAVELTAAEKKFLELYRDADAETKKKATAVLKGEVSDSSDILTNLIGSAIDMLGKK